jgi:phosphoribosylglycinamide formyltransferase-1
MMQRLVRLYLRTDIVLFLEDVLCKVSIYHILNRMKIGILISGRGSNMVALVDAVRSGEIPASQVAVVISDKPNAAGLAKAQERGVETVVIERKGRTREEHDAEIIADLKKHEVELVCLAGYMRLLSPSFIQAFPNRIINIHPSLLPGFPGLNVHERVLAAGEKVSGCTVHFVNEDLDAGPIILQREVEVKEGDTVDSLSARILEREHKLYVEAVKQLASESLSDSDGITSEVVLRDVVEDDLSFFFDFQLDPDASYMAAFTHKDPTDREAFTAHWNKILADPTTINKTIVCDGQVVGSVASFEESAKLEVTYWIGKAYWGKGIATRALTAFLVKVDTRRPIYARVAKDNLASRRVLEKCGFVVIGGSKGYANARGEEIEELLLELPTNE